VASFRKVDLAALCRRVSLLGLLPADARPRRTGNDAYVARCSFHEDSRPSMSVRLLSTGWRFHCFTCGEDGSLLDYYVRTRKVTLREALKALGGDGEADAPVRLEKRRGYVIACNFCPTWAVLRPCERNRCMEVAGKYGEHADLVDCINHAEMRGWHVGATYSLCPVCVDTRLTDPHWHASLRVDLEQRLAVRDGSNEARAMLVPAAVDSGVGQVRQTRVREASATQA
jgi:hypothetical protein